MPALEGKNLGMSILKLFATLIPVIILAANLCETSVLTIGGHYVITGSMTLGEFAAFSSYISILIFPVLVIKAMSNVIVTSHCFMAVSILH